MKQALTLLLVCFVAFSSYKVYAQAPADTTQLPRFGVTKTSAETIRTDTLKSDLKDPENIKTGVYYDEKTGTFVYGTKLGDEFLEAPFSMTAEEYADWCMKRQMGSFFRNKNSEEFKSKGKKKFDFTDMHFSLGKAEKIFGPGGVRVKTQGSAELKIGGNMRFVDNPSLSERNRKVFGFDFDEKINLSLNGKVGDKINMNFNYNTEATFDFDAQNIKLRYEGKEDEIIKLLEAGNISMPSNNSLVRGASSLFGIRADLQFGKLTLQTVVSQKKSSSQSVSSKGGVQLTDFEFSADNYEENRHFFLAHYFRNHYDENMAKLPNILSGITINRIEIWVTNKNGATSNTRNIIAFADLGEYSNIGNYFWAPYTDQTPSNNSNTLYSELQGALAAARDISAATATLDGYGLQGGIDYEKLESARLLNTSEYYLNSALGYFSLKSTLQPDQVLAVAFEYTYRGKTYQVGEFSTDSKDNTRALFVKALKNTACTPTQYNWDLMMRNVYSLGATSVQKDKFRLDIKYLSDTTGVYLSYIPEPELKGQKIIRLLGMDRLDNANNRNPNGYFDYVEGYTINSSTGRVYLPSVEPFGSNVMNAILDAPTAQKYAYMELYDSTKTIAKQIAERNKFLITGKYKATKNDEIQLGAMNIPKGSVVVTAGGMTLVEGSDYTVDYVSGIVRILNQSILDAGTSINVSLESNSEYGMQRKTMVGLNWQYDFTKNFKLAGTIMHLGEKPLTTKVAMGNEPLNNTIWGLGFSWKKESQWLTNMLDKIPFVDCTAPSSLNLTAEFAQLITGKIKDAQGNASYIDDFENTKSEIDISSPTEWFISSVPSVFPESKLTNDIRYGYNRALLAWYYIDPLFTRRSSNITPGHIKGDLEQLSDHDVREVYKTELFPNRQINYQESATLNVLNLAYYPNERGPYNLDTNIDADGHLKNPASRWGGMMRKLDNSDFETANIEYIEFWMMDPFIKARKNGENISGNLYINLGEISEDVLKDGKKFYESGLPTDAASASHVVETAWGKVPTQNAVTYAFNTSSGSRQKQDVGYNGLTSEEERSFKPYADYLASVRPIVRGAVYDSILASPSADKYHYFRGSDFDEAQTSILNRYKYINNPNGNSVDAEHSPESYSTAYKNTPDVEDINQDYTLNEYEKYFQYRVNIAPEAMNVGSGYIVDKRVASVQLRNGNTEDVAWYLFRIPVDQYEKREGGIADFSSIRFMRMYLTGFETPVVLRLATLNLVRGDWRSYEQALYAGKSPDASGTLSVSAVNFEENNEKAPVNYVIPPGISRVIDPGQTQVLQNNEQALSMVVSGLAPGDARAVYKQTNLDLRRYKHIQMFAHANALPEGGAVENGQTSIFIRLGSDYKNNFYEYEIPLVITPERNYGNSDAEAALVWPAENMLDIDLSLLTDVKKNRNKQKALGLASYTQLYAEYDPAKPANKVSVMGNPTLGEVRTIMIGVRNNSRSIRSVEVWANELRLQNFSNNGGWAAKGNLTLQLSDLASVNLSGHLETEGFGGLEETVSQRRDDNLYQFSVSTNVDAGRFLPKQVKLKAPIYYAYSKERTSPRYNPLDTDMELEDALDGLANDHERDSLKNIVEKVVINKNFSLSNARVDIKSKRFPMPYDPANFSFTYSQSMRHTTGETTAWEKEQDWKWGFNYNFSPKYKSYEPFKKSKKKSKWFKILKEQSFNYIPQNIGFNSDITRNYYELQERDMENLDNTTIPLTWSSDFLWRRSFNLRWDITKAIHASFSSGTNAEIEQPYTAVNKDLYPDQYTAWKDSVWHSIKDMGSPLSYQQAFDFSWKLPFNKLPILDWFNSDVSYKSTYNWARGAELDDGSSLGGNIASSRTINGNAKFNLETLYNHSKFLKEVNKKFSGKSSSSSSSKKKDEKKNFSKEIQLKSDTTVNVQHNQRSKNIRVVALTADGKKYPVRYKVLDANRIQITSRDTVKVKLTVTPKKRKEDQGWYKTMQYVSRGLMMIRNVNVSYRMTDNLSLPGFMPNMGDYFGQHSGGGLQPGLDFAFGFVDEGYIEKAANRGWLLMSDSVITPATTNKNTDLQIRMTLEPARDFKIDLNASRVENEAASIQYMFESMPATRTGSFTMTTISIGSAFEKMGSESNGYKSKTFDKFVASLDDYRRRVEAQYAGAHYPAGSRLEGETFDAANGGVNKYASEVMIPAFLSAYTGGDGLDIFPKLKRLLPNWNVTYSGLTKLKRMKKVFRTFNLKHSYKSVYAVGSYNSFSSWQEYMGGLGFVQDVATGMPVPSCPYDISTVSINESFSPLLGVDMTFQNGITAKAEYRRTRVLNLSMTSQQLSETRSADWVFGVGYKINDLKLFVPKRTVRTKGGRKGRSSDEASDSKSSGAKTNSQGFANTFNVRLDFSLRDQSALNRDIITNFSQATSGNKAIQVSFSAEYALSRYLTLSLYYDRQKNTPLLTSSSYPTVTQDFGVNLKFTLNR